MGRKLGKRRIARPGDVYNGNVVLAEDGRDDYGYVMLLMQCGPCGKHTPHAARVPDHAQRALQDAQLRLRIEGPGEC